MPELDTYRGKRDAAKTPEPVPKKSAARRRRTKSSDLSFVIQEHHATALHWDFRLERDGVLVSWAVPKNLPVDPKQNHLAVHTEDHPMEYAGFSGDIPEGEYGGGHVDVWDHGTYVCEKWSDDEVKVVLSGSRVSGRYVLFKTGKRDRDWMVHRMDPPPDGYVPMPTDVSPMLATSTSTLPRDDKQWGFEFKWDGVRAVVWVDGGRAKALSRNGKDITASYPELRAMAEWLGSRRVVLDGELVTFDADGRPSFGMLQSRMHVTKGVAVNRLAASTPVTYLIFDLLYLDGRSMLDTSYQERREVLDSLTISGDHWQTTPWFAGGGKEVFTASQDQRLEGVVMKRLDSVYSTGSRSKNWLKLKNFRQQEVVLIGWKPGDGRRKGLVGSLLMAVNDDDGNLSYAGHVGTGFTDKMLRDLDGDLSPLAADNPPVDVPRADAKGAQWVRPELVGEIEFAEWTKDGRLRQPSWRGMRPDKSPDEVRRES